MPLGKSVGVSIPTAVMLGNDKAVAQPTLDLSWRVWVTYPSGFATFLGAIMTSKNPPRWSGDMTTVEDIEKFELHLLRVDTVTGVQREYPAAVRISGDAFHLIRAEYKAQVRGLLRRLGTAVFGGGLTEVFAQEVGLALWGKYSGQLDSITPRIRYIHSHYMAIEVETINSGVIYYQDVIAIDNPSGIQ